MMILFKIQYSQKGGSRIDSLSKNKYPGRNGHNLCRTRGWRSPRYPL